MSHFTVAVIAESVDDVDDILAPYDENMRVPRYVEYTKEQLIQRERKDMEEFKNTTYAEYRKDPVAYAEKHDNPGHIHYLQTEFPNKLLFTDEELYTAAVKGYEEENIGEHGEIYSTYNAKSKWDWYSVGGRWDGSLLVKDQSAYIGVGDAGAFGSNIPDKDVPEGYRWVDYALIQDVQWDKMRELIEKQLIPYEEYMKQDSFYKPEYMKRLYPDAENYKKKLLAFSTYAVVPFEEEWTGKGDMGWFGFSSDTPEESIKWDLEFFDRFIKTANPLYYIVMVDCHI
jgi:hypothetical protein